MSNLHLPSDPPGWLLDMLGRRAEPDEYATVLVSLIEAIRVPQVLPGDVVVTLLGWLPCAQRDQLVIGLDRLELIEKKLVRQWFAATDGKRASVRGPGGSGPRGRGRRQHRTRTANPE